LGAASRPVVPDEEEPEAADEPAGVRRELYETSLRQLPPEERATRAKLADEPELSALCFDPLPAVIHALIDNPRLGLPQARLVASHHRTPAGLEALAARPAVAADAAGRRALLRSPQLSTALPRPRH